MNYYISKQVPLEFDQAVEAVTAALKNEGMGVLTEIDVQATLKEKLDVDFRRYRILGACHPPSAYEALLAEERIGVLLPCNVMVQETRSGAVEIAAIDPLAAMGMLENPRLTAVATQIRDRLRRVLDATGPVS